MQAEPIQPQEYFCPNCYNEILAVSPQCPRCSHTMKTRSSIRFNGIVRVIFGVFLAFVCVLISLFELLVNYPALTPSTTFGFIVVAFFASTLVYCLMWIIGGACEAIRGRTGKSFWRIAHGVYVVSTLCAIAGKLLYVYFLYQFFTH